MKVGIIALPQSDFLGDGPLGVVNGTAVLQALPRVYAWMWDKCDMVFILRLDREDVLDPQIDVFAPNFIDTFPPHAIVGTPGHDVVSVIDTEESIVLPSDSTFYGTEGFFDFCKAFKLPGIISVKQFDPTQNTNWDHVVQHFVKLEMTGIVCTGLYPQQTLFPVLTSIVRSVERPLPIAVLQETLGARDAVEVELFCGAVKQLGGSVI